MTSRAGVSEIWDEAERVAPQCSTMAQVGRVVDSVIDETLSDSRWRGMLKDFPRQRERVRRLLHTARTQEQAHIHIKPTDMRGMVVSDIHAPYHDIDAISVAVNVAKWWAPDVLVFNGDDLDFYGLSKYDKDPQRATGTQDEIDQWHTDAVAPLLDAVGSGCRRIKTIGNHEDRLERVLWRNPGLYGLRALSFVKLLDLETYGIELARQRVTFGSLLEVSHGTRVSKHAAYSARAEMDLRRYQISTITGHVHRQGRYQTKAGDRQIVAQEGGCLCGLEPEYGSWMDWAHGFTLFEIYDGHLAITPVSIQSDYTASVAGKHFKA